MSQPEGSRPTYGYSPGASLDIARMPVPGNAEFLVYVIVLIVFGLIAIFDDGTPGVSGQDFVQAATIVSAAYLLSRGIAKAGRVLEQ